MENEHKHRVAAWWSSGQTALAKSDSARTPSTLPCRGQFGGLEGRWTPEDLFVGAVASCYTTRFHVIADSSKSDYHDLEVGAERTATKTGSGYSFSEIVLRPSLTIPSEDGWERAVTRLQKARELCLLSRALATAQSFETKISISQQTSVCAR